MFHLQKDLIMNDEILTKFMESLMDLQFAFRIGHDIEEMKIDGRDKTATVESITVNTKFSQNEGVTSEDEDQSL